MNLTIESLLNIDTSSYAAEDHGIDAKQDPSDNYHSTSQSRTAFILKRVLTSTERMSTAILSVAVSILVPEFSSMMAFLGSCTSFLLCVIGPISAKIALGERASWFDIGILLLAVVMATWGTFAAFWSVA